MTSPPISQSFSFSSSNFPRIATWTYLWFLSSFGFGPPNAAGRLSFAFRGRIPSKLERFRPSWHNAEGATSLLACPCTASACPRLPHSPPWACGICFGSGAASSRPRCWPSCLSKSCCSGHWCPFGRHYACCACSWGSPCWSLFQACQTQRRSSLVSQFWTVYRWKNWRKWSCEA